MKKTNFFKLLMVGVAFAVGFASCNYVKQSEFDEICAKVKSLEETTAGLQAKLGAIGGYVVKIEPKSLNSNILVVTYANPASTAEITVGTGTGVTISDLSIGANGNWYSGSTDTGIPVYGTPKIVDGVWQFPVIKDGKVEYQAGEPATNSTYVVNNNGVYTLYVPTKDGELQPISLPSVGSSVGTIKILGWAANWDDLAANLEPKTSDFGIFHSAAEAALTNAEGAANEKWAFAGKDGAVQGGAMTIVKGATLYDNGNTNTGIIVEVTPNTTDFTAAKGMVMQNSKGDQAPFAFGTPKLITGYLTRAKASSGLYFIPLEMPAAPTKITAAKFAEGFGQAGGDAAWSLVTPDGVRSTYADFKLVSKPVQQTTVLAAVDKVNGKAKVGGNFIIPIGKAVGATMAAGAYAKQADGTACADPTNPTTDATHSSSVIDWYFKASAADVAKFGLLFSDKNQKVLATYPASAALGASFTLTVHKIGVNGIATTEDITVIPVSEAIAGETVKIDEYIVQDAYPVATKTNYLSTKIDIPLTSMINALKAVSNGAGGTKYDDWKANVDKYQVEVTIDGVKDNQWGERFYGATPAISAALAAVDAGDKHRFVAKAADASTVAATYASTFTATGTADIQNGQSVVFGTKTGSPSVIYALAPNAAGNASIKEFTKMSVVPTYAYKKDAKPTATFAIGSKHTVTINFEDANGVVLSTISAEFTPQLPDLGKMFSVRTSGKWVDGVLYAYYSRPLDAAAAFTGVGNFYTTALVKNGSATESVYYNVLDNGNAHTAAAPTDGGWTAVPSFTDGTTKQWVYYADIALKNPDSKINDNTKLSALVATGTAAFQTVAGSGTLASPANYDNGTYSTLIELKNQTIATHKADDAYNTPIDMKWNIGKYLGIYSYTDEQKAAGAPDFKVQLMSQLERGTIAPVGTITVPAGATSASGGLGKIVAANIKATSYNPSETYSIFPVFTGDASKWATIATDWAGSIQPANNWKYEYSYIKSVKFEVPTAHKGNYKIMVETNTYGTYEEGTRAAVGQVIGKDAEGKNIYGSCLLVETKALAVETPVTVDITVLDRFGRTKKTSFPFTITTK